MTTNFAKLVEQAIAPKLVLIRGVSGSGKTTYAKKIIKENPEFSHYEADMYFHAPDGDYKFDPKLLPKAHEWCRSQTEKDLRDGKSVIVSNTFTKQWEIQPYINLAKKLGVDLVIKKAVGNYKNVHGVPDSAVDAMKSRWEDVPGEELI